MKVAAAPVAAQQKMLYNFKPLFALYCSNLTEKQLEVLLFVFFVDAN